MGLYSCFLHFLKSDTCVLFSYLFNVLTALSFHSDECSVDISYIDSVSVECVYTVFHCIRSVHIIMLNNIEGWSLHLFTHLFITVYVQVSLTFLHPSSMTFYIKELLKHHPKYSRKCELWLAFCIAKQTSKCYADIRHLINFDASIFLSTSNADTC